MNDMVNIGESVLATVLLFSGPDIHDFMHKCKAVLNKLTTWPKLNKIKISRDKTKAIIFCGKNKKVDSHQMIYIDDQPVQIINLGSISLAI